VIDVRMTQNDGVNCVDVKRKRVPIALLVLRSTLDEAALEEDRVIAGANYIKRTRHLTRSTEKLQLETHFLDSFSGPLQ